MDDKTGTKGTNNSPEDQTVQLHPDTLRQLINDSQTPEVAILWHLELERKIEWTNLSFQGFWAGNDMAPLVVLTQKLGREDAKLHAYDWLLNRYSQEIIEGDPPDFVNDQLDEMSWKAYTWALKKSTDYQSYMKVYISFADNNEITGSYAIAEISSGSDSPMWVEETVTATVFANGDVKINKLFVDGDSLQSTQMCEILSVQRNRLQIRQRVADLINPTKHGHARILHQRSNQIRSLVVDHYRRTMRVSHEYRAGK